MSAPIAQPEVRFGTEAQRMSKLAAAVESAQPPPPATDREAFEAWVSDNGQSPKAVERNQNGEYKLMQTNTLWMGCAFGMRAKLAAREAQPMTDEQAWQLIAEVQINPSGGKPTLVRAVEKYHGIGAKS